MKRLAILIAFFIVNVAAYCQVANDECSTAQTLTPSASCIPVTGTLLQATTTSTTFGCSGNSDVFYKFTAISNSAVIRVVGSSGLDAVVGMFDYCGNASSMYCMDFYGNGGTETISATSLIVGATYYIKVQAYSFYIPSTYTFSICVTSIGSPIPPANDDCSNAQILPLSSSCNPVSGTILNASTSSGGTGCNSYNDVFYKFIANASSATISVAGSSNLDVVLSMFNTCGSSTPLYCADNWASGGVETIYATGLTPGQTYYIGVQSYMYTPYSYTFTICVQSISTVIPANDNCANAIPLVPSPLCAATFGTLLNATSSSIANSCTGTNDVFYFFEATAATATVSILPAADMDVAIGVYESCGGANISCTDGLGIGGTENAALTGLVVGSRYIVQVQKSALTTSVSGDFSICVIGAIPPPPLNDECSDAFTINPSMIYTPITGTVKSATTSVSTTSCIGNSDVFYKFTATARTATITVVGSSGFDPVVGLFKSCGTSYVDCVDFDYNAGGTESLAPKNLIVGATYYIKVQDYSTTLPTTFTFTVAVQSADAITGTDAAESLQQISLFPNPVQNVLNIENIQMTTTVELVDLNGKVLLSKEFSTDSQMDLSEFSAGIYLLKLSVNGVVENRRVIITK